jgi:DNA-binding Lrp family transcriptional regulator
MFELILQGDFSPTPIDYKIVALSLLLAFLCGHVIAWIYTLTHNGMSYSRSFVKALVVMPVIVSLVLMVLSNSIVTAFGLMAVLAIVRFRNVLRDTLDTSYLLAAIVLGMSAGTQRFTTTVLGCVVLGSIFVYLWFTSFGTRQSYDCIVNLNWKHPLDQLGQLSTVIGRHTITTVCASQNSARTGGTDLSYRLTMRDPRRVEELITELRELPGVERVHSIAAEDESEL